jgi:hypothetical protein
MHHTTLDPLSSLVLEARQHPVGSLNRQRSLTQLIRQMQQSGKIWRDYRLTVEQQQEALQRTFVWFCQNLDRYDPTQSSLMGWFNFRLKYRIKDVLQESYQDQRRHLNLTDDETFNLIETIPAATTDEPLEILAETLAWLQRERPQLEQITIRDRPDIDAYTLLLLRLPTPNQISWKDLSAQWNVAIPTLSSFYRRQCLSLLRQYGTQQGWFEPSVVVA